MSTSQPYVAGHAAPGADSVSERRPFPLWVRLVLLADLAIALAYAWVGVRDRSHGVWFGYAWAVLIVAPYAWSSMLTWRHPRPAIRGVTAAMTLLVGGAVLGFSLLLWSDGGSGALDLARLRLGLWIIAAANAVVLVWTVAATFRERDGIGEAIIAFLFGFHWPAVTPLIAFSLGAPLDLFAAGARASAEDVLARKVIAVQRCAFAWADADPDGHYPPSLDALGPDGTRCLGQGEPKLARVETLRYVPLSDEQGRIHGFEVRGHRATEPSPYTVVANDAGVVAHRAALLTAEQQARKSDQVPLQLGRLRDCLEHQRSRGSLPATAAELKQVARATPPVGCGAGVPQTLVDSSEFANRMADGYRFTYATADGDYRLEARPVRYAEHGLRSYLMTPDGEIHVTLEDRPATIADWQLPHCLPHDEGDCVPTPAMETPRVAFLVDTLAEVGPAFRVWIRVLGDTTRVPRGITYAFQCDVGAADSVAAPSDRLYWHDGDSGKSSCAPTIVDPSLGDRKIVRVWLRSAGGVLAWQEDTVRIVEGRYGRD